MAQKRPFFRTEAGQALSSISAFSSAILELFFAIKCSGALPFLSSWLMDVGLVVSSSSVTCVGDSFIAAQWIGSLFVPSAVSTACGAAASSRCTWVIVPSPAARCRGVHPRRSTAAVAAGA